MDITPNRIEEFKEKRLAAGVRTATVNRDLAVLRRMLKIAERRRLLSRTPFNEVEFLEERKQRRQPHIVTFEEEERILAAAAPHVRALAALILETGLRSNREALTLKWEDVDLVNDAVRVRSSKTPAGERSVPLSTRCKAELSRWRDLLGPEFSPFVFPNIHNPSAPLTVQHIDDYRALNLVEVLAAIRRTNRQVVVAVEDPALADLLCRRLRSESARIGRIFELHISSTGAAEIASKRDIYPMPRLVLRGAQAS